MADDKQTGPSEPPKSPVIDPQITKELETENENIDQQQLELLTSQLPGFRFDNIEQLNDEELNIHFQKIIGDQDAEHKDDKDEVKQETTDPQLEDQQPEQDHSNAPVEPSHDIASTDNKENKPANRNLDPALALLSSETTNFKGLSIPNTSELVRETSESPALKAYRELMRNQQSVIAPVDVVHAQLAALPLTFTAPQHLSFNIQLLINTLPVLDNLATQILRIISQGPYQKIMELVSNRDSFAGIAFGNLIELFETTKRVYNSEESPFFTLENVTFGVWKYGEAAPDFFRGKEDTIEGTLRKVNLATFLLATLGLIDLGFFFLNEAFLDVFCPPQNLDPTRSLSNLKQDNTLQSTLLSSSFPFSQSSRAPNNQTKFLKSHAILFLELKTQAFISAIELGDRSKDEIIKDLFPDNLDEVLLKRKQPDFDATKQPIVRNSTLFTPAELDFLARCESRKENLMKVKEDDSLMEKYEWIKFLNDLLEYVSKNVGFLIWGPKGKITKELTRLKLGAESVTAKRQYDEEGKEVVTDKTEEEEHKTKKSRSYRQSRPTTFRRVWSQEEEEALRDGLKLKGTQWTAILELYGPGGSLSEALKNRTTLQLKDKARNWKMYYLKNGLELPEYLVKVTGESDRGYSHDSNRSAAKVERPKAGNRHANLQTGVSRPSQAASKPKKTDEGTDSSYEDIINNLFGANNERDKDIQKNAPAVRTENPEDATNELKDLVAQAFES